MNARVKLVNSMRDLSPPRKRGSRATVEAPGHRIPAFATGLSGEIISATITGVEPTGTDLKSSCADLIRASTSLFRALEGVDGRDKLGQDEISGSICSVIRPQDFPRTALRESGNPGISITCPGPPLSRGRRLENASNLITASCAGTTNRVECRTLIFATRY